MSRVRKRKKLSVDQLFYVYARVHMSLYLFAKFIAIHIYFAFLFFLKQYILSSYFVGTKFAFPCQRSVRFEVQFSRKLLNRLAACGKTGPQNEHSFTRESEFRSIEVAAKDILFQKEKKIIC